MFTNVCIAYNNFVFTVVVNICYLFNLKKKNSDVIEK